MIFIIFAKNNFCKAMESIQVETGQHVIIAYEPASLLHRAGAVLIDGVIQILYVVAIVFGGSELNFEVFDNPFFLFFILILPVLTYHFFFEAFMNGQTPGKLWLNIRVTNIDGSATSLGSYFLRWLLRPIDMFMGGGLGAFFILFTKNHQRIGDLAAGTIVIKTKRKVEIEDEYYNFDDNYRPLYPQVEKLSEGQINLIRQILKLDWHDNIDSYRQLVLKIKETIGVETQEQDVSFLKRIIKDYNYYSSLGI